MSQLTKNFNLSEFFRTQDRAMASIALLDKRLVLRLQEIRDYFNKPITITSGYRTPQHNASVGGVPHSQHLYGRAADIIVLDIPVQDVQAFMIKNYSDGGLGKGETFTHIDVRWSDKLVVFDY